MTAKDQIYLDEKFAAQKENFDLKFTHANAMARELNDATNTRLDTIVSQNEIRNHRTERLEEGERVIIKQINSLDAKYEKKTGDVEGKMAKINLTCGYVQKAKRDKIVSNRWIIGILIVAFGIYVTWITKRTTAKIPVDIFYQKSDSTLHVPRMYFRSETGELREVSIDYFDIKK